MTMDSIDRDLRGMVLRIERSSIHDGDGFRTVVFLKGCPLRCQWCSTPESQAFEVERAEDKVYGMEMTAQDVLREVRKDSVFFFHSGGGMTLSGGEPLSQPEFSLALLRGARHDCIHTAMETTLFAPAQVVDAALAHLNLLFVDVKLIDDDRHKDYCGVSNKVILSNLLRTNDYPGDLNLVVRVPLIPGLNDDRAELTRIGQFCRQLRHLSRLQLLPYHRLGADTYRKLGRNYLLSHVLPPDQKQMLHAKSIVAQFLDCVV